MKLNHYLIVLASGIFISCQNSSSSTEKDESTKIVTEQTCYSYIKNRDTASLMVMTSGHVVTGELNYKLFEKDSNKGLIKGEMRGDTLLANYTFLSEGVESTRQVAFLQKEGTLIEGIGDVIEKDGKMVFKNTSTLKFGQSIEFTKVNCK